MFTPLEARNCEGNRVQKNYSMKALMASLNCGKNTESCGHEEYEKPATKAKHQVSFGGELQNLKRLIRRRIWNR